MMEIPGAKVTLARRLEAAHAAAGAASAAEVERAAGGWLIFAGANLPWSQALGLGLEGPVTAGELDHVEAFSARGGPGSQSTLALWRTSPSSNCWPNAATV